VQVIRTSRCGPVCWNAWLWVASAIFGTSLIEATRYLSRCDFPRSVTMSPTLILSSRAKNPMPYVSESTCPAITVDPKASPACALPSHRPTCRGLCVSAVTFYRDVELPRSAPQRQATPLPGQPRHQPSARLRPPRRRLPHLNPSQRLRRSRRNCRKVLVPLNPGILLMASPLRDGSFDVAEIVLFATPSSSIWLGPPKVALAGVPLRQGQAGCLSGPNERWESACCGSWWSYQQAHPACTGSSHEKDRVAVQLERNHDSQHPLPGRAAL